MCRDTKGGEPLPATFRSETSHPRFVHRADQVFYLRQKAFIGKRGSLKRANGVIQAAT